MKGRHNHTSTAALTNIQKLLLLHYIDSFSLSGTWCHTGTILDRSGSSQTLWHLRVQSSGVLFPHTVMFFLCPLQRPHGVCHLAQVPTQGCVPSAPTGALQRHSLQGCSTGIERRSKKQYWKLPSSGQNLQWQKQGTQEMILFWGKHLRLSHLVRHWSLPALQWIHTPALSRTGAWL